MDEATQIDETVYLHTHMTIPLRSKSKLIIPLDTFSYTYLFKDHDRSILLKYVDNCHLDFTLLSLKNKKNLNPCTNTVRLYNFLLTLITLLLYFIFLYVNFGIIIISLFNPIIIIALGFVQMKVIKKISGIRLLLLQKRKMKDLKVFLQNENERYYSKKKLEWSLGDKANWIQIDLKRGFLSNKKENSNNSTTKKKLIDY